MATTEVDNVPEEAQFRRRESVLMDRGSGSVQVVEEDFIALK